MPMHSFDVYLRSLRDLVELALSCPYDVPPKIQYVGSVTVFQSTHKNLLYIFLTA